MVICLQPGADIHTAQLMPLPLTASCFSKIQIGFTFLAPAHTGSPGQKAVKRVCVCVLCMLCGQCQQSHTHFHTTLQSHTVTYYLFCLESQLDEYLLQFLVHIVDAELLEPILLENLETVNVKNANVDIFARLSHRLVHSLRQIYIHTC